MKTKTLLASIALASLAMAQPISAATRSADSLPQRGVQSTSAVERVGSLDKDSEELAGRPVIAIVLVAALAAILVVALTGGKSKG
jgi:hypothetical protein